MNIAFGITRPCQAQPFGCLDICTSLYSFSTLVLILTTVALSQVWHMREKKLGIQVANMGGNAVAAFSWIMGNTSYKFKGLLN